MAAVVVDLGAAVVSGLVGVITDCAGAVSSTSD